MWCAQSAKACRECRRPICPKHCNRANGCCMPCVEAVQEAVREGRCTDQQEEEAIEAIGGAEAATYGEMTPLGFRSMAERVGLCKGDVFVDLGSGLGRVVLQAAREFAVRRSIGVEYALSRHTLAEEAREASASTQSVEFIHGDCADADVWRAALHDATVMYVSNLLFGEELQERLAQRLEEVDSTRPQSIRLVLTLKPFHRVPNGYVEDEGEPQLVVETSWRAPEELQVVGQIEHNGSRVYAYRPQ